MQEETGVLRAKLDLLEREASDLRRNFSLLSQHHSEAKKALREMVELSLVAARFAATAAANAVIAAKKSVLTAEKVSSEKVLFPANIAVQAASCAAAAAVESATAATQAVTAAAKAAAHEDDKAAYDTLMRNVANAEVEAKRAAAQALEAIKLAFRMTQDLAVKGRQKSHT